jgi:L-ascorbate metabolism protein UlaG (beta-lactamase superfamily)
MRRGPALPVLLLAAMGLGACARVGGPVPGAPPHHREQGFANVNVPDPPVSRWTRAAFIVRRILGSTFSPKTANLPVAPNDGAALRANRGEPTLTWIGHATLLIQLDGVNILTDPQWSPRASPVAFGGPRRVTPPGLAFEALPLIHVVVISHDHYDHLDVATVTRLWQAHRPRFLAPLGIKAWLADLGVTDVEELDWWQERLVRGVRFTCVPARHFSGRGFWDRNRRLWSGWVVAGRERRLFFAGDTAYDEVFKEIGRRLGPFDLAAIPIGAYLPPHIMRWSHTTPEEALQVLADVQGRALVPIHWGTFDLADEPIAEPPERLGAEARRLGLGPERVWLFKHGETRRW